MATFSTEPAASEVVAPAGNSAFAAPSNLRTGIILGVVWIAAVAYAGANLKRGWIPHDEGTLAQSAIRVLQGELPHRDFDEIYTGGLAFVNGLALRAFGENLASLRIPLFLLFAFWVPAVYYVASRFLPDYAAGALTLLAAVYSLPNYSAPLPSWYNLFFAVFGMAALLRHLETGHRRWLFAAGLCGALSILAKISGLYFLAAALLFLVYREVSLSLEDEDCFPGGARRFLYPACIAAGLFLFLVLLTQMILKFPGANQIFNFVVPAAALVLMLLYREFAEAELPAIRRFRSLLAMGVPFGIGVALPIGVFLVPYVRSGATRFLIRGLFVLPMRRMGYATLLSPSFSDMLPFAGVLAVLTTAYWLRGTVRWAFNGVLILCATLLLWYARQSDTAYTLAWNSLETSLPFVVLAGAVLLALPRFARELPDQRRQQLMLVLGVAALGTLVQFPFSAEIYFCYVAPLLFLAAAAILGSVPRAPRLTLAVVMVFYGLFAVWNAKPGFVYNLGQFYVPDQQITPLNSPRGGGLRGDPDQAQLYEELIPALQAHASGEYIYAGPDCPEVYFLAGYKNPTRTFFDFIDDPETHTAYTLAAIEEHHVKVVALNEEPAFSAGLNDDIESVLDERFPYSKRVGTFDVRWRQ